MGVIIAGTFHHRGTREWWSVRDRKQAVVIDLRDEKYRRLVVQVDDPEATVESIQRAIAQP